MLPSLARSTSNSLRANASRAAANSSRTIARTSRGAPTRAAAQAQRSVVAVYRETAAYTQSRSYYMSRRIMNNAEETKEASKEELAAVEEAAPPTGPLSAEEAAKLHEELATTKKALDATAKALSEQKERLARSYADLENTIRIAKRDVANAKEFGIKGFAVKLFDVIDTVELCLANMPKTGVEEGSQLESAIIALDAVNKQFIRVMAEYDVTPVEAKVGDKFDAQFHNAVFEMAAPSPDTPLQSIGVILKGGWARKDVLVRPTHVGVVMRPHGN